MAFDWKCPAVIGASFALTAVVVVLALLGGFYWYRFRPQSWDASTIKGITTTAAETFNLDEQKHEFTASGFVLTFVLENTSKSDYTVPENLRLFERSSKSGALEELKAKLDHPFAVPAKEKTEVRATVDYGCSEGDMTTGKTSERDGAPVLMTLSAV